MSHIHQNDQSIKSNRINQSCLLGVTSLINPLKRLSLYFFLSSFLSFARLLARDVFKMAKINNDSKQLELEL